MFRNRDNISIYYILVYKSNEVIWKKIMHINSFVTYLPFSKLKKGKLNLILKIGGIIYNKYSSNKK